MQNALDETRILILGSQVFLGFQFRATFEPGYEALPHHTQYLKFVALVLMMIAVGMLMSPGPYHQIVERGEDNDRIHSFATSIAELALLPFAIGFGVDLFLAVEKLMGSAAGIICGALIILIALFFWYGIEAIMRPRRAPEIREEQEMGEKQGDKSGTKIKDKIKHVLTEARVVLPGAQAMLGFQLAVLLMESFDKLPESSKYVHLASLSMIALSVILLMTPAAYHRIVERGEETEHFHRFASRLLLAAMVPLALGLSGDFFIVTRKVTGATGLAVGLTALMLALFYGLWFGFTVYVRGERKPSSELPADRGAQRQVD